MSKKIAIIGAASGQLPLCKKAKEMGLEVFVFAWDKNAVCKPYADHFIDISITEKKQIANYCEKIGIDGITSNCSDLTAEVVSYIATKLHLNGIDYNHFQTVRDKYQVRQLAQGVNGLTPIHAYKHGDISHNIYPCIVKPVGGSSKLGVSFVENEAELNAAINYAGNNKDAITIEEYIAGKEISVETISFHGQHHIIQTTDKDTSGAPHFVELGHHQPAQLPSEIEQKLQLVIPELLSKVGYDNSAAHIEFRYDKGNLYLIEINPRGGGDEISNKLVSLSSGQDYLRYIVEVALGEQPTIPTHLPRSKYSGIYFLCLQTKQYLPAFMDTKIPKWLVEKHVDTTLLYDSTSNYDRNGYIIYQADHKIELV